MNLGGISLIVLLAAIVIGFWRNLNVGILSLAFAMVLGVIYNIPTKEILSGFNSSLLIQMAGVTFLFGIINENGTLILTAKKMVRLTGKHIMLIPVVMYLIGAVISGVGPGAIPSLAIMPVVAIPVAMSAGLNPIMLSVIADLGVMAARMSPLTPEASVVADLMEQQGIDGNTVPIMAALAVTTIVIAIVVFIGFKGWRIDPSATNTKEELQPMRPINGLSIGALAALAVGVLFFHMNVGLMGFAMGSVILLFDGDSRKAIKNVPWNVIWMVLGVGLLMNIIELSGGVELLVAALQKVVTRNSASTVMGLLGGFMSLFSSGLGVVFPTLIPTAGELAQSVSADAVEICAAIVIGGTVVGFTPISTTGALIMAGVAQQENNERFSQNKIFIQLFVISFVALGILAVLSHTGVYDFVLGLF